MADRPLAPVVKCDRCTMVAPLRMRQSGTADQWTEGEARLAELRVDGWTLTDSLDLCPRHTRERARDARRG